MSLNSVCISGNLGRDAELRSTQSGTSVLSFCIAVNERRKGQDGDWHDYANWIDCAIFGKRAEGLAPYLTKGTKLAVQGRLRWHSWQDRETGANRSKVDVIASEVEFLSRGDGQRNAREVVEDAFPGAQVTEERDAYYADEDVPFD